MDGGWRGGHWGGVVGVVVVGGLIREGHLTIAFLSLFA